MAGNVCPTSVYVCTMRVTRTEPNGVPDPGPNNQITSSAAVKIGWRKVQRDGQDITSANGCGDLCVSTKEKDALKWYDLSIEVCTLDPELMEMLTSGTLLTRAGASRGWMSQAIGAANDDTGLIIEAWSKNFQGGVQDPDFPFVRWVFAYATNLSLGDGELAAAALNPTYSGQVFGNPNLYDGPGNDLSDLFDQDPNDRPFMWALDTDMPAATCGYLTVASS